MKLYRKLKCGALNCKIDYGGSNLGRVVKSLNVEFKKSRVCFGIRTDTVAIGEWFESWEEPLHVSHRFLEK